MIAALEAANEYLISYGDIRTSELHRIRRLLTKDAEPFNNYLNPVAALSSMISNNIN
jgi:hypothetical protein